MFTGKNSVARTLALSLAVSTAFICYDSLAAYEPDVVAAARPLPRLFLELRLAPTPQRSPPAPATPRTLQPCKSRYSSREM